MVRIGARNVRGTIQAPVKSTAASGFETITWTALAAGEYAEVRPSAGREFFLGQQTFGELTATLRFRYRADLTEEMRFVADRGDVWSFESPPADPDGKRREVRITAVRRDNEQE